MINNTEPKPITTGGLLGHMFKELVTPGTPKARFERIDLLLRKTHIVGSLTIPIPNLVAFSLIRKLDTADPVFWLSEVLFILHAQHHEDILFASGTERDRAKHRFLSKIPATEFPRYYFAVCETLDAVEKKSQNSSKEYLQRIANATSQLNSSHSPTNPDNPSATSQPN